MPEKKATSHMTNGHPDADPGPHESARPRGAR